MLWELSAGNDIVVTTHGTPTTGTLSAGSLTASKSDTSAISIEAYDVGTITLSQLLMVIGKFTD